MKIKEYISDIIMFVLNHIISHIPVWSIRKFFYKLCGMKIGKKSRILMGVYVYAPWKITIGDGTYINEYCILDGRGGLDIKNNVSLSIKTTILTGTHDSKSDIFKFKSSPVTLEDNTWTGVGSTILPGVVLKRKSILAAGSVMINNRKFECEENMIYSGVPAVKICSRHLEHNYNLGDWKPFLR